MVPASTIRAASQGGECVSQLVDLALASGDSDEVGNLLRQ